MPTCPHPACPCGHKNVTAEALLNHVQTSPWAHLYLCPTCKCVCKSETVLALHKQKVHKIAFYATPASPQPQPRASPSPAPVSCRICDRTYTSSSALEQHFRDTPVHPKCTRCNLGFLDNTAIQAHTASVHHTTPSLAFSCRVCNVGYTSGNALDQHYREAPVHPKCTDCDIGFLDGTTLRTHLDAVHRPPPNFLSTACLTCNVVYSSKTALEQHYAESLEHPNCTKCHTGFPDNAARQTHVVAVHRPIICNTCDDLQVYQEDVAQHYRISPKHPSCTVCDIGFENKEALDQHINTSHPGFRCQKCDLAFASADLLGTHYQESPVHPRCPECQLSFEDNVALIKHVIAIFNPLIKDSGRLILKTSQMSLHDAFSDTSAVSPATRSPSVARSFKEPSISGRTPIYSMASSASILERQITASTQSHAVASGLDGYISDGARSPLGPTSSVSSPSLISRVQSVSDDKATALGVFEEREDTYSPEPAHEPDVTAFAQHSRPFSPARSHTTRSIVAASGTASPVSSARSIFGKAPSIASISWNSAAVTAPTFGATSTSFSFENGSPTKASLVNTVRSRGSSPRSGSTDTRRGMDHDAGPISPTSVKTVSPRSSHVVSPSSGLSERVRMTSPDNPLRAPKSRDSEGFRSPEPVAVRQTSPPEDVAKAELGSAKLVASPSPSPTVGATYPSVQPPTDLAPGEKLVSYIYCRICRRDPCRQPAATMCGHVFCHQCISSEVMKTSRCPVCEAPTLLYSIFKLHLA